MNGATATVSTPIDFFRDNLSGPRESTSRWTQISLEYVDRETPFALWLAYATCLSLVSRAMEITDKDIIPFNPDAARMEHREPEAQQIPSGNDRKKGKSKKRIPFGNDGKKSNIPYTEVVCPPA